MKWLVEISLFGLFAVCSIPSLAQRKVSADVEVKTAAAGKVTTVNKSVYCANNGRLVTIMRNPVESYILTNTKGEFKIWIPAGNQTFSDVSMDYSSFGDLVYLSMCGRLDDLGLLALGYKLQTTVREEGYLKKTFVTAGSGKAAKVLLVLKDYLPIYCEYISDKGAVLNRTYYSDYRNFARIMMPCRITAVDYGTKKDSTVTRTIYSNVQVDVDDPAFGFEVPADAKPAKLDLSKRK